MGFDSISNSSSPLPPFSKDLAKKKRVISTIIVSFFLSLTEKFSKLEGIIRFWIVLDGLSVMSNAILFCFIFSFIFSGNVVLNHLNCRDFDGWVYFLLWFAFQTNRSARLKQSKLDVRREQWLSQGMWWIKFISPVLSEFYRTAECSPLCSIDYLENIGKEEKIEMLSLRFFSPFKFVHMKQVSKQRQCRHEIENFIAVSLPPCSTTKHKTKRCLIGGKCSEK